MFKVFEQEKENKQIRENVDNKKKSYELEIQKKEALLKEKVEENKNKEINLEQEYFSKKDNVIQIFKNKIGSNDLFRISNTSHINEEIQRIQGQINEAKLNIHRIELDEKNILPKLEDLARKTEELEGVREELKEVAFIGQAINIAKLNLELAYNEMKNNISPKFTEKLSETIKNISNGKYSKVRLSDEYGLIVENEKGDYVPAGALSVGTIEQLYLSLRLATIDDISNEKLPIILDEAFAYFDNTRLENLIKFIKENYGDRQLIIFTCTNREESILEKIGYDFEIIKL